METTEITSKEPAPIQPELVLTNDAQYYLQQIGRWARFLGILGFVGTGLVLIAAMFIGVIFSMVSQFQPQAAPAAGMGGLMSFLYILIAIFYFFWSLYLYQFGTGIKKGINYSDSIQVATALGKLKSHFKLIGITAIVTLILYALIFVIVIIAGMAGLMNR